MIEKWTIDCWFKEATIQYWAWISENTSFDWKTKEWTWIHSAWVRKVQINFICWVSWPIQRLHWGIQQENRTNEARAWEFEMRMG